MIRMSFVMTFLSINISFLKSSKVLFSKRLFLN